MDAIKNYGITKWHRKSFAPCKIEDQSKDIITLSESRFVLISICNGIT